MKIYRLFSILLIMISLIGINGCSEDNSDPGSPESGNNNTPPSLPSVNFPAPRSDNRNPVMSLISGYVQSINVLRIYSDAVKGIEAERQNDNWVWSYVRDSLTITLTASQLPNGDYQWNVFLSGTKDNSFYDNWLSAAGISSADGKTGTWKIFRDNSTILEGEYLWDKSADGTITGTAIAYRDGAETGRIELLNHPDSSGQVIVYVLDNLFFKADWQTDGSGHWWRYGFNGSVLDEGTWT